MAQQLCSLIASGRFVHAFLFCGGSKDSRSELGMDFSKALLCERSSGDACGSCVSCRSFDSGNNADFLLVALPDGRASIGVETIADMQQRLLYKALGQKHVVLIRDAELLTAAAQNKLLKTLEEPTGDTVIVLLAERRDAMLDTVRSRCIVYELEEPATEMDPALRSAAEELLRLFIADAPYYKRKACIAPILDNKDAARESALAFLDIFEELAADAAVRNGIAAGIYTSELAENARKQLKQGHSVPYTLKQMCLGRKAWR